MTSGVAVHREQMDRSGMDRVSVGRVSGSSVAVISCPHRGESCVSESQASHLHLKKRS